MPDDADREISQRTKTAGVPVGTQAGRWHTSGSMGVVLASLFRKRQRQGYGQACRKRAPNIERQPPSGGAAYGANGAGSSGQTAWIVDLGACGHVLALWLGPG